MPKRDLIYFVGIAFKKLMANNAIFASKVYVITPSSVVA
ncbi:hypothetical protein Swoo_3855 [Shewanella woodyi ATCC 51908]|uniref:Uncharacterized protein n=1 Tax=Shewanella woodyi (strain ATCC 51908 / MS32) TaxID=392500 RepID=B1KFD8_SHEWM|nr:hypothetical protein Swoo_3855 [Shewanella woodyi ATCC 51908]